LCRRSPPLDVTQHLTQQRGAALALLGRGQHGRERERSVTPFAHELGRRDGESLGHVVEPLSNI
jgi:hypothetical protein